MRVIILFLSCLFSYVCSPNLIAQCPDNASAGDPINPVPDGTTICNDGSNQEILANDVLTVGYEFVDTYAFIVTAPPNAAGDEELLDATFDGIYDFSMDSVGLPYLPGEYCFTGFGFIQSQLDDITNNGIVQSLLNDCVQGGETLDVVLDCIRENPIETGGDPGEVPTIDDIANILNELVCPLLGYCPCVVFAEPYCVTVLDPSLCGEVSGCIASAGLPINPVPDSIVICSDGSNMDLLLQDLSSIDSSGTDNYAFFVTAPPDSLGDENIIGTTYDGVFNFADSPDGKAFPSGKYCFVGVGYNQSELDMITNGSGMFPEVPDCVEGGQALDEWIHCLNVESGLPPLTPDELDGLFTSLSPFLNTEDCLVLAEPYCVMVDTICGPIMSIPSITPNSIEAYPNPAENTAYIEFYSLISAHVSFELYTVDGRLVKAATQLAQTGNNRFVVDVSALATGIYAYKLECEGSAFTRRLIVY